MSRNVTFAIFAICFALATTIRVQAQEETPEATDATQTAETAETTDAAESTEATAGPAAVESRPFAEVFEQWKTLLGKLRDVREDFEKAEDESLPEIAERHKALVAEALTLMPQLRQSAMTTYAEAPNKDRAVTRLLYSMAEDDTNRDNYEPAIELTRLLAENDCREAGIHNLAGIAAYCTNDFDQAEIYFNQARENEALEGQGRDFEANLAQYKKLWEDESRQRATEAAADDLPRVKMVTSKGEVLIELFENEAPQTVGNFVSLVESGYYDGLIFHRVLNGFMAQGGCPDGTGKGGPGYNIFCECDRPEARQHFRGSLSMAHAGRDTGGSQFFLTFVPTSHLNEKHTVFGRVVEGFEMLAKLNRIDPESFSPQPPPDRIISATVVRKRDHEYAPTKVE